jgi:hypothetical protein
MNTIASMRLALTEITMYLEQHHHDDPEAQPLIDSAKILVKMRDCSNPERREAYDEMIAALVVLRDTR